MSRPRLKINRPAPIFAALGDETRLRIVARLSAGGPMSIARLTREAFGTRRAVSRQAITKHLHVLAHAGLARSSRLGRESVWEFQPAPLDAARSCLNDISAQWDAALERLKIFVEQ
jgi:DNA-binding transcriptional ArsR family regulator